MTGAESAIAIAGNATTLPQEHLARLPASFSPTRCTLPHAPQLASTCAAGVEADRYHSNTRLVSMPHNAYLQVLSARGLIGFRSEFLSLTSGTGILTHVFDHYGPLGAQGIGQRRNGVMISQEDGHAVAYALFNLQDRGTFFVEPGDVVYEGMIVGENNRPQDLDVNMTKEKKLTNMRAAAAEELEKIPPPREMSLEEAIEFIREDELIEITPEVFRLRKRHLDPHERKKAQMQTAG